MAVTEKDISRIERRQDVLEQEVQNLHRQSAARVERDKHVDISLEAIKKDVESFSSDFKWAARAVIGGILAAFVTWVVNGGLAGGS